ncbi:MAG: hypothetical protein K2X99_01860 [Gemmatimonadaceae bacterium]|nr:hypothetical protein [Gemmatimonadaceae bacterium]
MSETATDNDGVRSIGWFDGSVVLALKSDAVRGVLDLAALQEAQWLRGLRFRMVRDRAIAHMSNIGRIATAERLLRTVQITVPVLREAALAAGAPWREELQRAERYATALLETLSTFLSVATERPRCLDESAGCWLTSHEAMEVLRRQAGAPQSRWALRARIRAAAPFFRPIAVEHVARVARDERRWDALDLEWRALRTFGSGADRRRALELLWCVGLGRPDPADTRWQQLLESPRAASAFEEYARRLGQGP